MKIPSGVIGLLIKVTLKEDGAAINASTASVKKIKFRSPSGTVQERDASFFTNGSDGIITYTTVLDDIVVSGTRNEIWSIQAYVELASGFKSHTFIDKFEVEANLS